MSVIISSTFTLGHAQTNGTRYVTEMHTWDDDTYTILEYGPVPDTVDHQAIANARAEQIMEQMAQQEFEEVLNGA